MPVGTGGLIGAPSTPPGTGGGSGTVTSVAATNSNGVTFTITNPTTTPNISIAVATQAIGDNTTNIATTAFVQSRLLATDSYLASITYQ